MIKFYYFNDPDNMGQNSIGSNYAPLIEGFTEISVDQLKDDEDRLVAINICNIKTEEEFDHFCYIADVRKEYEHLKEYTQIEEYSIPLKEERKKEGLTLLNNFLEYLGFKKIDRNHYRLENKVIYIHKITLCVDYYTGFILKGDSIFESESLRGFPTLYLSNWEDIEKVKKEVENWLLKIHLYSVLQ